jgi:hypothetical protein
VAFEGSIEAVWNIFLLEGVVRPVRADTEESVNLPVVAATNHDLELDIRDAAS